MSSPNKIPVLMYHALTEKHNSRFSPVHIPVTLFNQEMKWLSENNYHTVTMNELQDGLLKNRNDAGKYCIISFDDGYRSLYDHAMPVLKQYGFTATLYLTTAIVGQQNFSAMQDVDTASIPDADRPLTWDEVKSMIENGWSVQSHSISHADHSKLSHEQLLEELTGSKKIIEEQIQQPVQHYAFPFGKYNVLSLNAVKKVGYRSAVSVHPGLCGLKSDPWRLPRLEMNCDDSLNTFIKKMETGFISPKEKWRSSIRNLLFRNAKIKDLSKRIAGDKIN